MSPKPSIRAAVPAIARALDQASTRVHSLSDLRALFEENRLKWRLPASATPTKLIRALCDDGRLSVLELAAVEHATRFTRYAWRDPSPFSVALSLRSRSYLSHGSAVFLRGLTEQVPHTLAVNKEQSPKPPPDPESLTQASLNRAFANEARTSRLVVPYRDYSFLLLSGKNTGNLEVSDVTLETGEAVACTKIERTLIDIAVRPNYAGGVFEVAEVYRRALPRLSINVLLATLKRLDYVYPYHQAIGFYLERAGADGAQLQKLAELGLRFDFHLTNKLSFPKFSTRWRLHHPDGL
jgi:predicted transcriptional regulator of viral defense system